MAPAVAVGNDAQADVTIPRVDLAVQGPVTCTDEQGVVFEGDAYTYQSLVRGPLYAPTVMWFGSSVTDPKAQPALPVSFTSHVNDDVLWRTVDGGTTLEGQLADHSFTDRPLGIGPAVTYSGRRVSCTWDRTGYTDFGTFTITKRMATNLGLPPSTIGRRVNFDNESPPITAVFPRYLFPTTATTVAPTLPTPVGDAFAKLWFPRAYSTDPLSTQTVNGGIECRRLSDQAVLYRGSAWTLAPLVRGYTWSPMAYWLSTGRELTPVWFWTQTGDGQWFTVDGGPYRTGSFSAYQSGSPSGYGSEPDNATSGVECRWDNPFNARYVVTEALLKQVPDLPAYLLGRTVRLYADYSQTYSYVPTWQFN